jgi:hypothetical protein
VSLALRLLKEVAGATRTALGSTNSDNTDQLGNKVTTSIKNQAINKTEGLLNNSVNETKCKKMLELIEYT